MSRERGNRRRNTTVSPRQRRSQAKRANARRMRQMRKRKIRNTLILMGCLILLLSAGLGAIYLLKGGQLSRETLSYQAAREFSGISLNDHQKAGSLAADLCVTEEDVTLESADLLPQQQGALFDLDNQKVLFSQGLYDRVYPASITKIMTGMLALQYGNMDEIVTISQENVTLESGSQVCGFQAGDKVTLDELVHALMEYSGNDGASAIAEHVCGSEAAFVEQMNAYAKKLGMTGTHFSNPHGLQDEEHYTTPYDIYLMLNEALTYEEFTEITELNSYTITYERADGTEVATPLESTDHYLTGESTPPKDVTVLGGKTGTTSLAGNCLALITQNAYGKPFISIVMGADTKETLYQQMNSLLENINS